VRSANGETKSPNSLLIESFSEDLRFNGKSVAIVCVVYWEIWMILEDLIATCPFRPPRNVGCAYWSSFLYYVLVRSANQEHDLFTRMVLNMQCFTKMYAFWYSHDILYKVVAENEIGIMRPGYGISLHRPPALELSPTPQAMHTKQS
jgi:hypothetical protein